MNTLKASLALVAVLILAGLNAGCSVVEIRGTVTEMEIEESKKTCAPAKPGKAPKCTTVPKCYEMDVEDAWGKVHEFCVDPNVFEDYKVGDMYPHKDRN